jgi:hypothetical protein
LLVFSQWTELKQHSESVPLGSTVTFLALSGVAFAWARLENDITPLQQRIAKKAGVDLFSASMLALVAQGLIWAVPVFTKVSASFADLMLLVHSLLLALSLLMAWIPLRRLLIMAAAEPSP